MTEEKTEQPAIFIVYADGRAVLAPNVTLRQLQQIAAMLERIWSDSLDMPIKAVQP